MIRVPRPVLALTLGLCTMPAVTTVSGAQTADTPPAAQVSPPPSPLPAAPATLANDLRARFVAQQPDDIVTSRLVGLSIQNGANETIGQVADVVFDGSRTIKAFVVSVGGFLGIGAKYVAVDPSALRLTRVDDRTLKAVIETDRDQLRAAPEYRYLNDAKPKEGAPKPEAQVDPAPADPAPTKP